MKPFIISNFIPFKLGLLLILIINQLSVVQSQVLEMPKKYQHNFSFFPVYEGYVLKYEQKLFSLRNKSLRYSLTLKGTDENSYLIPFKSYNEQKFAIQIRNYRKNTSTFKGFYHGTCFQFKKFEGESQIWDFRTSHIQEYGLISLGLGYTIGYQFMNKSGFNYEIGWALYYQLVEGVPFKNAFLPADIPYNPYNTFNSQLTFGIGYAL